MGTELVDWAANSGHFYEDDAGCCAAVVLFFDFVTLKISCLFGRLIVKLYGIIFFDHLDAI